MQHGVHDDVLRSPGVSLASPASPEDLEWAARMRVPESLRLLLARANGLLAYGGYFRILGIGGSSAIEAVSWNDRDTWKFAWPAPVSEYLCFGETAFGDQYAFRYDELSRSKPPVYFLEALTLQPETFSEDFDAFLRDDFLRNATQPHDDMIASARQRLGDLALDEHVTYSPSPLITGRESVEHVTKLPTVASMILNGDLASQLSAAPVEGQIQRLDVVSDDKGRSRIKIVWADATAN